MKDTLSGPYHSMIRLSYYDRGLLHTMNDYRGLVLHTMIQFLHTMIRLALSYYDRCLSYYEDLGRTDVVNRKTQTQAPTRPTALAVAAEIDWGLATRTGQISSNFKLKSLLHM